MSVQEDVIRLAAMLEGGEQDDDTSFAKEFARSAYNAAKRGQGFDEWFDAFKAAAEKHGDRHE